MKITVPGGFILGAQFFKKIFGYDENYFVNYPYDTILYLVDENTKAVQYNKILKILLEMSPQIVRHIKESHS